ncbi:hypothetical protein [Mycobacterium sp. 155]|uniref:hypothetical protein n=1 Tax=Mycobacterium sp. 155 TaxID=1157943 RepID=UPI0003742EAB|nr:hypothetical protein [Mycobacterium sp. 155]
MTYADNGAFDDDAPEADAVEQLTPVNIDDDMSESSRIRISPDADADEADLIEQATVVPIDDDLDFDR